ncbi:MAG: hypothetical protein ABW157_22275 [Candidatus Thiodiazotropha sp. LLP2]
MPQKHVAYYLKPKSHQQVKDLSESTARRYDDLLTRHRLSYLNSGRSSGKKDESDQVVSL